MDNNGVGSWLQRRRRKSGAKTALLFSAGTAAGTLSYEELAEGADRLANALRDRGVAKGDRVAYLGEKPSLLRGDVLRLRPPRRHLRAAEHPARAA